MNPTADGPSKVPVAGAPTGGPAPRSVPAHDVLEIRPKRKRYSCVVFVLDEGERFKRQLERMRPLGEIVDVIIADGGSTDGSVAEEVLRGSVARALLVKKGPGRLGAQMRVAFAYALDQGYEGIVTIDGNDKDDPGAMPLFVEALEAGFDHAQGSRFIRGGRAIRTPWSRLLGIRLIHAPLISLASRFRYTDTTNGFRGYSRRLLQDPRVAPLRDVFSGYELHYYLAIRAARLGFRVTEIPVTRSYPGTGPVPTKISPLRGNLALLGTLISACRHRFDPPVI